VKGAPGEAKKEPSSKKPFVIAGSTRNPVRQSDFFEVASPSPQPSPARGEGEFLRRFAPEKTILDSGLSQQ
jgi:hypothetical protein